MGAALTSFKALLRRALRRRAMTSVPTLKTLFNMPNAMGPVNFNVDGFEIQYLTQCGESIRQSLSDPATRDILSLAYISELKLLKEKVGSQHEYIVVHVHVRLNDSDLPVFLGVVKAERTVHEDVTAKQHVSFVVNDSIRRSSSASSIPGFSPNPTTEALDRVFIYDPCDVAELDRNDHNLLYHYTYNPEGPPFFTFVVSTIALHIYSPNYTLFQHQCFWYAGMLFRMVGGKDAETREPHDKSEKAWEDVKFVAVEKKVGSKPGRFMDVFRVITNKDITQEFVRIEPAFEARLAEKTNVLLRVRQEKEEEIQKAAAEDAKKAKLEQDNAKKDATIAAKDEEIVTVRRENASKDAEIDALKKRLARMTAAQSDQPLASTSQLDYPLAHQT
ncbi:hypothetical protein BD413DRAFT_231976 [Trametes elegans]|nr:hypothetical protein BD413DRAFT_231976 [Trametes elegans]